ncbi:MAG: Hsp70 family protein, partial [Lachnospiraceae bacterium]|nr:Hsp70 family protein [Lachnospiraceae bacterium]
IMVYDLGGGTFDVSVIEIGDNLIEVLSTAGDNHLGGDDFDQRIADYLIQEFRRTERVDISRDPAAVKRVRDEAEKAKKELSSSTEVTVNLPFLSVDNNGPHHLEVRLTRARFDEMTRDLVERTSIPVKNALKDADVDPSELGMVLLVGGSTRIPAVQNEVRRLTGKEPSRNMNPDECVALGAAVQGSKFSSNALSAGSAAEIILMDVSPLSLSIETVGGVCTRIIERNTTIPTRHSQVFTTAANFQKAVDIKVYQGERRFAKDNKLLGNFRLDGIKRARAGVPQIEVTFDIDANGIVKVSAKDLGTGKEQAITITSSTNLTEEEIQQAMRDAAAYESQDKRQKELIDIRNDAESLTYRVDQFLKEDKEKKMLDKATRNRIKADLSELKKRVNKTKPEKITEREAGEIREVKERLEAEVAPYLNEPS